MNIFIFHRDLRLYDNTTLIEQCKNESNVSLVFIFTPEQADPNKNSYFSDKSFNFMLESLKELPDVHFFYGNTLDVISKLKEKYGINSIGYNIDYTPYARKRDSEILEYSLEHGIKIYSYEDITLVPVINGDTLNKSGKPYSVFTPFYNKCRKYKIRKCEDYHFPSFFKDKLKNEINLSKFRIKNSKYFKGGRTSGLSLLKNKIVRSDILAKTTSRLSAHLHFGTLSTREVFHSNTGNEKFIRQLYWRDFYINVTWFFPDILKGQISGKNQTFSKKEHKWSYNIKNFNKWKMGETGFPVVDACMKELLETGFMHNRGRLIVASFLCKDLHIDWRYGEKYFATKLVDYDPINNNGGWQWSSGTGTDASPYFRIMNPWVQSLRFDPNAEYIKKWLPELKDVPAKDIHNWNTEWHKYNIYIEPMLDHSVERLNALSLEFNK